MRITQSMIYRTSLTEVEKNRERLAITQEQASTGLAINRPSDDPIGVRTAALLRDQIAHVERYTMNLAVSRTSIQASEAALASAVDVMIRAEELTIGAISGGEEGGDAERRRAVSKEVEGLFDQLFKDANALVPGGGGYVFAGTRSDAQAFTLPGGWTGWDPAQPAPTVTWAGDNTEIAVDIDIAVQLTVTKDGERTFQPAGGEDAFSVLGELRDALLANDQGRLEAVLPRIQEVREYLNGIRTEVGAADAQADLWEQRLAIQNEELMKQLSLTENVDSIEVYTNLVQQESALNASLQVTSRLLQPSLMDFL